MTSPRGGYGFKSIPSYRLRKYWRHIGNTPRGKRLKITKKESLDILSAFSGNSSNNNSNSSNGGSTASSEFVLQRNTAYMKPFYELVKQRSKRENIDDSQIKTPSGELLDKVILGLSRRILELNPKLEGGYAQACAEKYHYAQCKSVDILFSDILEQMPEIAISEDVSKSSRKGPGARAVGVQRRRAFCVMENFLGALVEMGGVLLPQGFSRKFLHLGYSCLPKAIFIQYVERGVLTVTKGFVWSLYERGAYRKDFDFFYLLLCKLSVGNIVDILISKAPLPLFFVEHFLSRCPKVLFSDGLELDESSPFYPLSLVLQSLHKSVEALKAQESEILFRYADLPQKYREEEHVVADLEAIDKVVDTFYFYETLDLS